jgi:hypothetical protein
VLSGWGGGGQWSGLAQLTQLRHLQLVQCDAAALHMLGALSSLAAFGRLTLDLANLVEASADSWRPLAALTRLEELRLSVRDTTEQLPALAPALRCLELRVGRTSWPPAQASRGWSLRPGRCTSLSFQTASRP